MAIRSSEAIVLNRIPLGDTSLLVTVYARAFGKVKLVARGARRPKSRMASSLQPL
ncbi:MAG: DNA repair protein RecO, partial [Gemmatimonadetes bacterium]|nr:DNA repair protein RecO [Gemmatimonadota bacterium]